MNGIEYAPFVRSKAFLNSFSVASVNMGGYNQWSNPHNSDRLF